MKICETLVVKPRIAEYSAIYATPGGLPAYRIGCNVCGWIGPGNLPAVPTWYFVYSPHGPNQHRAAKREAYTAFVEHVKVAHPGYIPEDTAKIAATGYHGY